MTASPIVPTALGPCFRAMLFLLHPALERFYPPSKRIVIPDRLTVCGGVMLADALDVLIAELERVER